MFRFLSFALVFLFGLAHPLPAGVDSTDKPFLMPEFELAASSQDRCCNAGCIAEVTTTKPANVVKSINTTTKLSIYFEEGSSTLSAESIRAINIFLTSNPNLGDITVVGSTDGCGAPTHNISLSSRRASVVKNVILRQGNINVETRWSGEIVDGHSDMARRVDIASTDSVTLMSPPPRIIADFYLIDGSGSMSGGDWQKYVRSISYHRPRGSRVFISTTTCVPHGRNLNRINPAGGTEIWYSYWTLLDRMSAGDTLVIVSDFDSTYPLQPWERNTIAEKVSSVGVSVRTISP